MPGSITGETLRIRGRLSIDLQSFGIASRWREQLQSVAYEVHNAEIRIGRRLYNQRIPLGRAERIVARLQPFQTDEGEPSIWLLKIFRLLRAPRQQIGLPGTSGAVVISSNTQRESKKANGQRTHHPAVETLCHR